MLCACEVNAQMRVRIFHASARVVCLSALGWLLPGRSARSGRRMTAQDAWERRCVGQWHLELRILTHRRSAPHPRAALASLSPPSPLLVHLSADAKGRRRERGKRKISSIRRLLGQQPPHACQPAVGHMGTHPWCAPLACHRQRLVCSSHQLLSILSRGWFRPSFANE